MFCKGDLGMNKYKKVIVDVVHQYFWSLLPIFVLTLYVYLKIWTATDQLGISSGEDPIFVQVSLIFFFITIIIKILKDFDLFKEDLKKRKNYLFLFFIILSIVYYILTKNSTLILCCALGFALRHEKSKIIIIGTGVIALLFFLMQLSGYAAHIISDNNVMDWNRTLENGEEIRRYALGYSYPTRAFAYLLPACLAAIYIKKKEIKYIFLSVCIIFSLIVFYYTDTKTIVIITLLLIISPFLERVILDNRFFQKIFILSYPLFFVFSICMAYIGGHDWNNIINYALSYRPGFWFKYLSGDICLWGESQTSLILYQQNNPLDNMFLAPLISAGMIVSFLFVVWYVIFSFYIVKKKNVKLMIILIIFFVYGLSEAQIQPIIMIYLPLMYAFIFDTNILEYNSEDVDE